MAEKRKTVNLLPEYIRSEKNSKFLSSTIDQFIQEPELERINAFIGSKLTPNYNTILDLYLEKDTPLRRNYQLEPALIIKDSLSNVKDAIAYDDLLNEIKNQGGNTQDHNKLFKNEFSAYDPLIDWDKLINYSFYYWLPSGPESILIDNLSSNVLPSILGNQNYTTSYGYKLSNGMKLTFSKNETYNGFEISVGREYIVEGVGDSIVLVDFDKLEINKNFAETFNEKFDNAPFDSLPFDGDRKLPGTPEYITINKSSNDLNPWTRYNRWFHEDVIKTVALINNKSPIYPVQSKAKRPIIEFKANLKLYNYGVKGIGNVDLIDTITTNAFDQIDGTYGYYVDGVLVEGGQKVIFNNDLNENVKGKIYSIEFKNRIQINLIDTATTNLTSLLNGVVSSSIDGVPLLENQLVVYNAAADLTKRGIIYRVQQFNDNSVLKLRLVEFYKTKDRDLVYIKNGNSQSESRWYFNLSQSTWIKEIGDELIKSINYDPFLDSTVIKLVEFYNPNDLDSVAINLGNIYGGTEWYFSADDKNWKFGQQHASINDAPLFDLFDKNGISFTKQEITNDFSGTKIFGYEIGSGISDSILGFPLKNNNSGIGNYLFKNYFTTDTINVTIDNVTSQKSLALGYLKLGNFLVNVWSSAEGYKIPIVENQTVQTNTTTIELKSLDYPFDTSTQVISYVNNNIVQSTVSFNQTATVTFSQPLKENDAIYFNIFSNNSPNNNGFYEPVLNLTNNPLNGPISSFTLSELSDHVGSMIPKITNFQGQFPGKSNLRDLSNYSKFGTRLIINSTPLVYSKLFLAKKDHNVLDSLRFVGYLYNQYKLNLFDTLGKIESQFSPAEALDIALKYINRNNNIDSLFYRSDMVPYGEDKIVTEFTVGIVVNKIYPIRDNFDNTKLSFNALSVYVNDSLLINGQDYQINSLDSTVEILSNLSTGDKIKIYFYNDTTGSFVPPTPSKLGLYPKFKPAIVEDTSYVQGPVTMILGHDGSLTKAYGDYRDQIILEFEKRIYNNIKVSYNSKLFDMNSVISGAFRINRYTIDDSNNILIKEFINWTNQFNVNFSSNTTFDETNPFTFNYSTTVDTLFSKNVSGSWRGIYQYFYDTDKPHLTPWEMLGFNERPNWWTTTYGLAPYTSSNVLLWTDLSNGYIRGENRYNLNYARSGLLSIIPVDEFGNLKSPDTFLVSESSIFEKQQDWKFGDFSPAEVAWRRSSLWPFALNIVAALLDPCSYTSKLFDVSRTTINELNQILYNDDLYLNPNKLIFDNENNQSSGFGNLIIEYGRLKNLNYLNTLKNDLSFLDFNLFHKLGGFTSKNKIQLIMDTVDVSSMSQGAILPPENYDLILNKSNTIQSFRISGIVIQKYNGKFLIKGYDKSNPYFEIFPAIISGNSKSVTVGGIAEPFTEWSSITGNANSSVTFSDTTTANVNTTRYYKSGQLVRYNNSYYRVKVGHNASSNFDPTLFQPISKLPVKGGVTVLVPSLFESRSVRIPYGTMYSTIQEVYNVILGYSRWLESNGFIFDQYDNDLTEILDWKFSAKEFLFWTTQNWSNNNLITISPFAKSLKFGNKNSIVDDINYNSYEYNLLKADGKSFPKENIKLSRDDGICVIETVNTEEGLFFALLNTVQKEHAMIFDNRTLFNDIIYDLDTGYRQRRLKISGFRTANWNGDFFSPGFVYDEVFVGDWKPFVSYLPGSIVRYNGVYYQSNIKIVGSEFFNFNEWSKLREQPSPDLLPNFSYKINQFEDFYSLDIDNFDISQQQLAQHLIGYSERPYLNNIFTNPTTQYKFYQGYIKEKGTKNALDKIVKVGSYARKGSINFTEEWAFRVGHYGGYETFQEVEFKLNEGNSLENPYIVKFSNEVPAEKNNLINYILSEDILIKPTNFEINDVFKISKNEVQDESLFQFPSAGYVRPDDVNVTAYNTNSILDIANNNLLNEKDTIWIGFLDNGNWDVYRYSKQTAKITGVFVSSPGIDITFSCDLFHDLKIGDIVSVVNFNDQVNGIYNVKAVPKLNQFTVDSTLSSIVDDDLVELGSIFKFQSVRFEDFLKVSEFKELYKFENGEKIWVDKVDQKWSVYEKVKNYSTGTYFNSLGNPFGQELGYSIYARDNSQVVLVSSPSWNSGSANSVGRIWVYNQKQNILDKLFEYILNSNNKIYCSTSTNSEFGYTLNYDDGKELIFAGAPKASNIITNNTGTISFSTGTGSSKGFISEGLVKISREKSTVEEEETVAILLAPGSYSNTSAKANYLRFGNTIYVDKVNKSTATTVLIGAPGDGVNNTSTGFVFAYHLTTSTDSNAISLVQHTAGISLTSSVILTQYSKWGEKISGSDNGNFIAVSAPGFTTGSKTGLVEIFNKNLVSKQVIYSPFEENRTFGSDIFVSSSGKFLLISSPDIKNSDGTFGNIAVYSATNLTSTGTYVLNQIIENPSFTTDLKFGVSISLNKNEDILTVGALGRNRSSTYVFDENSNVGKTTFDKGSTEFISPVDDSGTVYVFNNLDGYFIQSEELSDSSILEGSRFGFSVSSLNDFILVGAPWIKNATSLDDSTFFKFDKLDTSINSWKVLRNQPNLVDSQKIKSIKLIDSFKEEIIEYLDIFDPVKGKIIGLAEQELKYKSTFDPAMYSIGTALNSVDSNSSWIDDHIGDLWWDLSTVKYLWYEQGDEIFRKNNWGKIFPGSSIDIYEWVKSDLLPSEWAAQADTNEGLTKGISGQPKYPDNSVMSVKQVFNNVTNSFENVYYFWVKNKVTVPNSRNRRISAIQVANLILDPAANGIRFASILSQNAISFANVQPILVGDRINSNISFDEINNNIPKHTEWLLLEEGNKDSVPTTTLTKKLFDSLLGHDDLGQTVPDLNLSVRNRYGIEIRPRQSMFKDRLLALRNLVEFTNSVLIKNKITGFYDFTNLNKKEEIPDILSREYDFIVDDLEELDQIDISKFSQAELIYSTYNGKVVSVEIINPGFGYSIPPKIEILSSSGEGAELLSEIDGSGRVINVIISNPGKNYLGNLDSSEKIIIRGHTTIVRTNSEYGNRWTKHLFNYEFKNWTRIQTQSYNTPLYWNYVDWVDENYNGYKDYAVVLKDPTELPIASSTVTGDYVKINNVGDGRYIILEKLDSDQIGDFALQYKIVYSQNGTIQISDEIWNFKESNYSYDAATLEETLYDQIPDQELNHILYALKDDIFVGNLKINWNLFFFKAVRYAFTEQKLLDWVFKTSFISVNNQVGELDQKSVYRLDNENYFEDYIREVKPYRTKIRSYTSKYSLTNETSNSVSTDFDLPAYFNTVSNSYELVGLTSSEITEYPWKWWADNYKYYVKNVLVADNGEGYTQNPTVVITPALGDTGSGATAEAYIRNGGVFKVLVSNPGSGYVRPPTVTIVGGGPNVVKPAKVSVELGNDYIRKNILGIKFDRTGVNEEIDSSRITETFECTGNNRFRLTWLAQPNKSKIVPLLDSKIIFSTDYTIEYFTENINNYTSQYCEFVFLNYIPKLGQKFKITYEKNISIYHAVDRINKFYQPTDDMVGKEIPLLMSGAEYKNTVIQGLNFGYSLPWNYGYFDNDSAWSNLVNYYTSAKLVKNINYSGTVLYLDSVEGVSIGQKILLTNTSTSHIRSDAVVSAVNTSTKTVSIANSEYRLKRIISDSLTTQGNIVFFTTEDFNGKITSGSIIEISGVDDGTILGFDGKYIVTNSGTDRFTAVGTGTHAITLLTTSTVKTLGVTAKVTVPAVFNEVNVNSLYNIYSFENLVSNTSTVAYDTNVLFNSVSTVTIYVNDLLYGSYYNVSTTSNNTYNVEIFNLNSNVTNKIKVDLYGYPIVEFWKDNFSFDELDTEISAGSWNGSGNFVGALGINPGDLVIDGSGLISQNIGQSPEEHVKGNTYESVSINVFTQENKSSPIAMSGIVPISANAISSFKLGVPLEESIYITVNFEGKMLDRIYEPPSSGVVDEYFFTTSSQFYVMNDELYIAPQDVNGKVGYNLLTIGGEYVADSVTLLTEYGQSTATLISSAFIDDIRSVYVTIDGREVNSSNYELIPAGPKNKRAAVRVTNIADSKRTIQAWFLKSNFGKFSQIFEEQFSIAAPTSSILVTNLLGTTEPLSAQVFVEVYEPDSTTLVKGRKRLNPPDVNYYKLDGSTTTFNIDNTSRPPGTYTNSNIKVYLNGRLLAPGFDYSINSVTGTVTISSGIASNGAILAIESLVNFDYVINNNTIIFTTPIQPSSSVKVISFADYDGMMLRTERFKGDAGLKFTLGLPVSDSRYVWVALNKQYLIANNDFTILDDFRTVSLNNSISIQSDDEITISYVSTTLRSNLVYGYKIFNDIFNRTTYSRLSNFYGTRLTKELKLTDTEIHVTDSSSLIPPNFHRNIPGVIFVDSERIEFFSKDSNVLSGLRRGTMGTSPAEISDVGTKVFDQSPQQFIPYTDTIKKQYHITSEATGTYVVNTVTNSNGTYTIAISSSSFVINTGTMYQSGGDGIILSTTNGLEQYLNDQISVKFGGRLLRKTASKVHDYNLAYDSTSTSLRTLDPEFTVKFNESTGNFELNIHVEDFTLRTKVEIEQKIGNYWNTSTSLMESESIQSKFIRRHSTEIPDKWYYGNSN
jgi:hypothetical protein